jgi:histidine triad (HIT) family protein
MTTNCLFCKIISGDIPGTIVYRDDDTTAFRDINPVAPTHIVIVPNRHIDSVNALEKIDETLMGHLFTVAGKLAKSEGIDQTGYRVIANTGPDGGQTVFHLHVHLIGGQRMKHRMG